MKALIHFGLPKAGSSSIQEFLKINRAALLARGIRHAPFNEAFGSQYELAATGVVGAGRRIVDAPARVALGLRSEADDLTYVESYRGFLDAALPTWSEELFVASSEHIQPWLHTAEMIRALDRFLTDRFSGVRYVLYLRRQSDIMLSAYSERIKRGETLDFDTHLTGRLMALNFNQIVRLWENAVGADRLDVRLLSPDALKGGDLIGDFCDAMGTTRDGLDEPARMNPALSAEELAARRRMNHWLPVLRKDGQPNALYFRVLEAWMRRQRARTPLTLTEPQRTQIEDHFARSNDRLRARRFPKRKSLF